MSKYPDNPLWYHAGDIPFPINDEDRWEQARSDGYLTPEHILVRLEAMLRVALGHPAHNGIMFDEDGFERAIVASGWQVDDCRLQLHTDDHDPPHLHLWLKGDPDYDVRLSLETGEPLAGEQLTPELRKRLKKKVTPFIAANRDLLLAKWGEAKPG